MNLLEPLAIGLVAGFLGTLLGIGGGSVMVPLLVLAGVDIKRAVPASLVAILGTSLGGLRRLYRRGLVDPRMAVFLETASILGAVVGVEVLGRLESRVLTLLLGLVLVVSAASFTAPERIRPGGGWGSSIEMPFWRLGLGWLVSLAAGLVSAVFGIGGGVLKVPLLVLVLGFDVHAAVATSKLMVGVTALTGVVGHALAGRVDPTLSLLLLAGTYTGATVSARVLLQLEARTLRLIAALYYLLTGLYMVARSLGTG